METRNFRGLEVQTHPGPRSRWKWLTGSTNDDLRAGRGNWAMGECIQKSILSPLKHDLRRGVMRTHQQRYASQGRMGTLQEGVGRDSAIAGVTGDGLHGGG